MTNCKNVLAKPNLIIYTLFKAITLVFPYPVILSTLPIKILQLNFWNPVMETKILLFLFKTLFTEFEFLIAFKSYSSLEYSMNICPPLYWRVLSFKVKRSMKFSKTIYLKYWEHFTNRIPSYVYHMKHSILITILKFIPHLLYKQWANIKRRNSQIRNSFIP